MKQKYKYKVKIYNAIGNYAGVLKFNILIEALRAYTSIKRAELYIHEKLINDEYILFALRVIAIIDDETPDAIINKNKKVKQNEKKKSKTIRKK